MTLPPRPEGELQRLVLEVLPDHLPGKGHMTIARAIQGRSDVKWTHQQLRAALYELKRRGLVHVTTRRDSEAYQIYWRDPSYVAPLDVGVV